MNINDELTQAAREGASGIVPAFASMTPKQQAKIVKALRKNNRERLEGILEDYARTLSNDQLNAIIAEGTD